MRSFFIVSFLAFASLALLGCKDDEEVAPSIPQTIILVHVRFQIAPEYMGWAWSRSAMPIVYGFVAALPTRFSASQRSELNPCATTYALLHCEWNVSVAVLNNSRELDLKLDEQFTLHNPIARVRIPLNDALFRPQTIRARGGTVTFWGEIIR